MIFGVLLLRSYIYTCFSFVFQLGLIADDEDAFRNYGGFFFFIGKGALLVLSVCSLLQYYKRLSFVTYYIFVFNT